jgi:bifunctional non-homologous end joining protein LigD
VSSIGDRSVQASLPLQRSDRVRLVWRTYVPRLSRVSGISPARLETYRPRFGFLKTGGCRHAGGARTVLGHDLADRFPLAVTAIAALPVKSCIVDGEAIACDDNGLAVFDLIRGHGRNGRAILCAFDLLEVNGQDVRPEPIEDRKRRLAGLLRLPHDGIALNEAFGGDGAVIYKHACALGCEGIVSKRLGSPYRAGRSPHWLKVKNPDAPAVRRLEEEDWA